MVEKDLSKGERMGNEISPYVVETDIYRGLLKATYDYADWYGEVVRGRPNWNPTTTSGVDEEVVMLAAEILGEEQ